jgi:PHD/YefM family antitoxin component YafN of YafNO toxin-antitoxin module
MAPPILSISAARQTFFDLFETVTGHRGRKIVITSRGVDNRAVLVGEDYLNELESAAKRLRDIESGKAQPVKDFKLVGSLKFTRDVDEVLNEIRAEQSSLWEKKAASFDK